MTSQTSPAVVHRPAGSGHPYATSPEQRVPLRPEVGQSARLGVVVAEGVSRVECEWEDLTAGTTARIPLEPAQVSAADAAALAGGDGHLAEAQAAVAAADGGWAVDSPVLEAGHLCRYRFLAEGETATEWFELSASEWVADAGELRLDVVPPRGADPEAYADLASVLEPGSVEWLRDAQGAVHKVRFALRLEPGEHVVGFGERFDAVDQRGRSLDAVVFEQYKSQGEHGRTYLPMPFAHVLGGRGWGFHVRTSTRTWFDVGQRDPGLTLVEALVCSLADTGSPVELELALYGGDPREVLESFVSEVGRAEELPAWVFRLWASGNEWNTQQLVLERMDTHRELDIPVGVIVIEAWSDEEGITIWRDAQYAVNPDGAPHRASDFTFPPEGAWPDPKAMIEELHSRGIKVLLWQIPLLKTEHDLGPEVPFEAQVLADGRAMVAAGHAVREEDGSPYHNRGWWFPQALMADLSTPEGRAWWTERRRYLVEHFDVDGFKTDGGEHAWGEELRYGDGRRGIDGNNLYPVHYAHAFGDLLRSCGKAPVTFSRAGFTGSQAHGIFWAGDESSTWQAFRSSVTAGITASASGIVYWGWDLAGFSGPVPEPELYLRAAAASAFMPIMQYHSEFNHHQRPLRDRTPWHVAETHGAPEVVDRFREIAPLRDRLVPSLAEQARRSVETAAPLMRGLFFTWPHDERVWDWPLEFTLGEDLLVHPVTEGGVETWDTYLPEGRWVDVWSEEVHEGGQVVTRAVPPAVVPVYCRAERWAELREVVHP